MAYIGQSSGRGHGETEQWGQAVTQCFPLLGRLLSLEHAGVRDADTSYGWKSLSNF